jgi:hypothetical protein
MAVFEIEGESISITPRDVERLVKKLREHPSSTVAEKLERATQLDSATRVDLAIGEDEEVLHALGELKASGDFLNPLARLERAIRAKIDRES